MSQLSDLKAPLLDIHTVILFVIGAKKAYPTWADRYRADTINKIDENNPATKAMLDSLIEDLLDASKAKKPNDNSNNSKPTGGALAAQNKDGNKGGNKGGKKGKGSKCNNCGDPNAYHKPEDCFATNTERRQAWEQKTGKTYIPYKEYKNGSNTGSAPGSLVLPVLINLQSNHWLADSGADGHIANNLACFDTFTPDTRTIDTADRPSKALGSGTVNLRLLRSDGTIRNVTLTDVTYIPKCPVNLFGARKLIKEQKGYILLGQLMLRTPSGDEEICALDENLFLRQAPAAEVTQVQLSQVNALLMARKPDDQKKPKALDIDLWHKRLGHLGLKNIKKTADITKGIKLTDTEPSKSPCKACSVAKPLKHIRKVVSKRAFKPFDRIHLDTFIINPIAYNSHKYGLIFTDEASHMH